VEKNIENIKQFVQWWKETIAWDAIPIARKLNKRTRFEKCKQIYFEDYRKLGLENMRKRAMMEAKRFVDMAEKGCTLLKKR
jgi:hypothetical protein